MSSANRIQQYKGTTTKWEPHQLPHPWMVITPPIYSHFWCEFEKKLVCRSKLLFLNCTYALFWQSLDISKQDVSSRTVINQIGTTSFFAQHVLPQSLHSILAAAGTFSSKARGKLWNWLPPILFLVGSVFFIENWLLRYCWWFLSSPITILTSSETRFFSGKFQTAN